MKNIVVLSAHPDDMEIGMGGTAVKMASSGASITSIVLTDGRRSPNPFQLSIEQLIQRRQNEATEAAALLGIQGVKFLGFEDLKEGNFDKAAEQLSQLFAQLQPAEIYTLHPEWDRHPTHRATGQIAMKVSDASMRIWAYEVWGLFPLWDRFEDISREIGVKLAAIQSHKSQTAVVPYADGVAGLNRWRAVFADPEQSQPKTTFAEVFLRLQ